MKFLKKICLGFLMILLVLDLFLLGLVSNIKATVKDAVSSVVKQEVAKEIVDNIGNQVNVDKEKVANDIKKVLEENKTFNTMLDKYYDVIVDALKNNESTININITEDIDSLITESEKILKEYNIELDEKMKSEIKKFASSNEMNKIINEDIVALKNEMPSEMSTAIDIFTFITSSTFKAILFGILAIIIILIGLLKKSYYQWLSNLGIASIGSAIPLILTPYFVNYLTTQMGEESITITLTSIATYGYVSIGIGIGEILLNTILKKMKNKKETKITE